MSTARFASPSCSLHAARSRTTAVEVRAVAIPKGTPRGLPSRAAAKETVKGTQQQQEKPQEVQSQRSLVEENNLHNSFYLPYHCVYQHNVIMDLPVQPKTRDAFDSSWSGSSYL